MRSAARPLAALDLVVPDLFDAEGGIARIARAMALALARWADRRGLVLTVHALMDQGGRRKLAYLPEPHDYRTYDGARARLAAALLEAAWREPARGRAVVFMHPNLAALELALPPWVRTAVVAHGIDVWTPLRLERRLALRRADALWPVSHDTARHLERTQGASPARVQVIPNALDPHWPLPEVAERGGRHLLAVSRLHPEHRYKGLDLTIEALARRADRPPLVIAGHGPDQARLEALAAARGVAVTFTGRVGDAALAALYRDAIAFVLPSTGEGFGLVYLEAMAFGLPCIAAAAGGAPEVVAHDRTGIVIPPGDVSALAAALTRVTSDEGAALGRAGRVRLEADYLYPTYEARVHAALERLISGDSRGAISGGSRGAISDGSRGAISDR